MDGHGHRHDSGVRAEHATVSPDADGRWLAIALTLIVAFMAAEVVVSVLSGSLALLTDAAHMLTDAAAILLAITAIRLAARPAQGSYTYGLKRAEILSAQANGLALLLLGGWLAYEAYRRMFSPHPVQGWPVVVTGLAGIAVNLAATWAMSRANRTSLNVEGAFQHILNDLYAFIATTIAGVVVLLTGFDRADTLASLVVVALMTRAGLGLLRESGRVLLNAAPVGLDPDEVADRLLAMDDVVEVHDMHLWLITSGQPTLSAHVLVTDGADCHGVRERLQHVLADDYRISHTTLEVDHEKTHTAMGGHCTEPHGATHRGDQHSHD
jgi:cobalt-zinc-cadmium efflux system protein